MKHKNEHEHHHLLERMAKLFKLNLDDLLEVHKDLMQKEHFMPQDSTISAGDEFLRLRSEQYLSAMVDRGLITPERHKDILGELNHF